MPRRQGFGLFAILPLPEEHDGALDVWFGRMPAVMEAGAKRKSNRAGRGYAAALEFMADFCAEPALLRLAPVR